ncbi:MAG: ComEA family DNA-binding protein [Balneolaceae bacterium]
MKRSLYFLLDKLHISRAERITISFLMISAVGLHTLTGMMSPTPSYSPEEYAVLEQIFLERSSSIQQEREKVDLRYEPLLAAETRSVTEPAMISSEADTVQTDEEASLQEPININTADAETLQLLPGIGPAYAQRIIEWRAEHGAFQTKEQLMDVRGIGPARLEAIRELIVL